MTFGRSSLLAVKRALAFAAAVTLLILSVEVAPARNYPCWMVRWYVNSHTQAEVDDMARRHQVTAAERRHALACLKESK